MTPPVASLAPGETVQFQAVVIGQEPISQGVVWSIDALPSGTPRDGWIEAGGMYHAPEVVSASRVAVRAVSTFDGTKAGVATVELPPRSFSIAPLYSEVMSGDAVQFTATVTGVLDTTLQWSSSCGSIDQGGLFRAPDLASTSPCTVYVACPASGDAAFAAVLILPRPSTLAGTSGPAAPGDLLTIYGTGLGAGTCIAAFTAAIDEPVLAECHYVPGGATVTVPVGAASGPLTLLEGKGGATLTPSSSVRFDRAPRLRLHPDRRDLSAGESTRLRVAFLGAPGPFPVTFDADVGTVVGEEYHAPAYVSATAYATVRACVTGTTNCTGVRLGLHPFRVDPDEPLVASGGSLALGAVVAGAPAQATFTLEAGAGSLTPDGRYQASTAIDDAGPVSIGVSQGTSMADVQVGIGGLVPGALWRSFDYVDYRNAADWGTVRWGASADALAVAGSRLYLAAGHTEVVSCTPGLCWPPPDEVPTYYWIDVYDLADPTRPRWLGAVESVTRPQGMFVAGNNLYLWSISDPSATAWVDPLRLLMSSFASMAVYDLSGPLPVLVRRHVDTGEMVTTGLGNGGKPIPVHDDGQVYDFQTLSIPRDHVHIDVYRTGDDPRTPPRTVTIVLPTDCWLDGIMTASANRVYAGVSCYLQRDKIFAWDIGPDPPIPLGGIDAPYFGVGSLVAMGSLLVEQHGHLSTFYDTSSGIPRPTGELPLGGSTLPVVASDGRVLFTGEEAIYEPAVTVGGTVVDALRPGGPTATATFYAGQHARGGAVLAGDLVYAAEGLGGVAIYDTRPAGGLLPRATLGAPDFVCGWEVYSAELQGSYLYGAGVWGCSGAVGSLLAVWDVSSAGSEGAPVWAENRSASPPYMPLAVDGGRLLLGTPDGLEIWSLADPARPAAVAVVPVDARSLAVDGSLAWVGTYGGQLVSVDLAAPAGPVVVGSLALGESVAAIRVLGSGRLLAAIAGSASGDVVLVDGSAPAAPIELGRGLLQLPVYDVDVSPGLAALATPSGLVTMDISDLAHPSLLAVVPLPPVSPFGETYQSPIAWSVRLRDRIAWIGSYAGRGAVYGMDVTVPSRPRLVSSNMFARKDPIDSLVIDGSRAFVTGARGITEVDIAQPRNVVRTHETPRVLQR